jgi:hypothetical protein
VNGLHWFGQSQIDYALYAITGFKSDRAASDIDFQQSHVPYYTDNNSRPTVGGRISATIRLSPRSDISFGASGQYGFCDPERHLTYAIVGADLSLRIARTDVRFEYLARRQEYDTSNPDAYRYEIPKGDAFFTKHGAYLEVIQPMTRRVDLVGRVDGMYREGNVLFASALAERSTVMRYTLGSMITLEPGLRLKLSSELWDFSDVGSDGKHTEATFHIALVGTY